MNIPIYIAIFILGTIIGSFLNVVIYRYKTGWSIISGRSRCMSCGHELAWFELLPVFSFIFLGGRCLKCHSKISWQYITVELLTAILFILAFWHDGGLLNWSQVLFSWIIISLLIVIGVYDWRHKIIPDHFVYTLIILGFFYQILTNWVWPFDLIFVNAILSGLYVTAPLAFLWLISRGRWMGFGDVKLTLGLGWWLGLTLGFYGLIWSFWLGAIFGVLAVAFKWTQFGKQITFKNEIPFAPFLILGFALVYFTGIGINFMQFLIK